MRREILHCNNVYADKFLSVRIEDINLTVFEGEVVCFVGAAESGKKLFFDILCGRQKLAAGKIRIENQVVEAYQKVTNKKMILINDIDLSVNSWKVYEYLFMIMSGSWGLLFLKKNKAKLLAQEILQSFQIHISSDAYWEQGQ